MQEEIHQALQQIELTHEIRVLYACESGSRAWGFASPDSDYDVRFVYVHRRDWYLSIDSGRDVIEESLPGDLDVSGWELRKAFRLFRKCNPALMEWLHSPTVYASKDGLRERLCGLPWYAEGQGTDLRFSPDRALRHYLNMAKGNVRNYFDTDLVPLKKYLYVLRPLLACQWIETRLTLPPVPFAELVEATVTDSALHAAIDDLVWQKRQVGEMDRGPKVPVLSEYIDRELERWEKGPNLPHAEPRTEDLNSLFNEMLNLWP